MPSESARDHAAGTVATVPIAAEAAEGRPSPGRCRGRSRRLCSRPCGSRSWTSIQPSIDASTASTFRRGLVVHTGIMASYFVRPLCQQDNGSRKRARTRSSGPAGESQGLHKGKGARPCEFVSQPARPFRMRALACSPPSPRASPRLTDSSQGAIVKHLGLDWTRRLGPIDPNRWNQAISKGCGSTGVTVPPMAGTV